MAAELINATQLLCLGQSVTKMMAVKHGLGKTMNRISPADLSSVHKAGENVARRGDLTDTPFSVTMPVTYYSLRACIFQKPQLYSCFYG